MESSMVKNNNISEIITQEIEKMKAEGSIDSKSKIYDNFNVYAKTIGLDVSFSVFKSSQISRVVKNGIDVPTMFIYLKSTKNLLDNKMNMEQNNWDGTYIYTNNLIEQWNRLLDKYNYPVAYKSSNVLLLFYSLEEFIRIEIVLLCKDEIRRMVEKEDIPIKPEFIFSNSRGPGYNMVFRSKSDYDLFMENSKKRIEKLIDEIIKIHDVWGYYTYKRIRLYYWHLEMKDINLYGLYRED
jgi:hypothetical protein